MEEDVQQINVDNSSSSNTAHIIIDHPSQLISRSSSPPPPPPPPPAGGASSAPSSSSSSAQPTLISSFLTHQQHPQPHHLHAAAAATSTISNPNPFLPLSSFSSRQISTFSLNPPPPPPPPQPTNSAPPPPLNAASSELADHPSPSAKRGKYVTILQAQWPLIPSLPISASASAAAAQLGGGAQSNIIINPNIPSASAGGGYNPNAPQLAVSPPSGPISSASAHSFSQSSSPSGSAVKTATMQGMSASSGGGGGGGKGAQTSAVGSPSVSQSASQSTLRLPYASNSNPNNPPPSHAMGGDAGGSLQATAADQPSSTTADGGGRSSVRKGKFVSPVWKPMEMLALAKAWRIQYSGGPAALSYSKAEASASSAGADQSSAAAHKAKTRAEKDWEVAEYLKQQGVQRDMKTAATKWDNMLGDFRRVHEWEKGPEREEAAAGKSYFCLSSAERKQHRLPASFDEDVYEEMIQYVGHRPRSIGGGGHRGGGGRALVMGHNVGTNSGVITLSDYQNMGGSSGAMVAVYNSGGSNPHCRVKQNLTEGMFGSGGGGAAHRALLIEAGEGIGGGGSLEQSPAAQEANNNNSIVNRVMAGGGGGGFMSSARMKRVGRVKMVWEESVQLWAEDTDTYYMNVNHPVATAITAATPTTITPPPPPQDHPMSHHLISSNHHSSHGMMSSTQDLYNNSMSNVSHKLNQEQGSHNNSGSSTLVRNMAAASSPPPPSVAAVAGRLKVESMSFLNADELVFLDESLTGNAIEVFEAGRLRGFSTHTFTPGQVIKVFGRRMNTTPPLPPLSTTPPSAPPSNLFSNISSPPPPLSSTHHHHHHLLSSTTAAAAAAPPPQQIINSGVAILRDRTSYYLSCLKISASTQLPDLSELPFLFNEPPPRDLRFPVRTDVFMDLPPGRDAFFVASNDTDCRSIVYEVVAPLLRSVKLGVEKDFLIGLWDDCINRIVKVFCTEDIELIRNNDRNNSSSCEEERANMCGLVRKLCLWRGEERGFVSNNSVGSDDPAIRLVNKLLWTYGELPYILGYYAIGMKVTFCALSKGEGEQHEKLLCTDLATISLSNPAERFSCLVPCWRVAQLLPLLADACGRLRNVHSDYSRAHSGSSKVVEVMVSQVRKSYPSRRRWAAVKHVYELLAEQRVPCVERLVKHDEASLSLAFKPRGQPVRPGTVEALIQALKCVCTALVSVHSMSLMHRDVRWENVMKRGDIEDEWFLIDFEDAVFEEGSSASSSTSSQQQQQQYYYYPHRLAPTDHAPEMCRGPHGLKVDVWGLGHLIRTCGLPHVPDHLKDLERRFTDPDPEQRPPIDDCFYLLMQVHSSLAHYNHHHHNQHHQ